MYILDGAIDWLSFGCNCWRALEKERSDEITLLTLRAACGSDVRGGEIFLLRRDALLVMVQVLERGCGWVQLLCKGLELQETSCHHVEAGTVEDIMDSGLGDCTLSSAAPALPWQNPWMMNTLEPLTKIPATVYSLADTQLTGSVPRPI